MYFQLTAVQHFATSFTTNFMFEDCCLIQYVQKMFKLNMLTVIWCVISDVIFNMFISLSFQVVAVNPNSLQDKVLYQAA